MSYPSFYKIEGKSRRVIVKEHVLGFPLRWITRKPVQDGGEGPWLEFRIDELERRLAEGPVITVPTITLEGDANGAPHPDPSAYAKKFSGKYAHRNINGGIGHNLPQEAPQAFAQAVIDVDGL